MFSIYIRLPHCQFDTRVSWRCGESSLIKHPYPPIGVLNRARANLWLRPF